MTPVTQATGVRSGGTLAPATPRVPPAPEATVRGSGGVRSSGAGVHYGGTRTTSSGAGVRYGGFGSACHGDAYVLGSSWRRLYVRPVPRYIDPWVPVTVINVWGFGSCDCAPVIVTPPPVFVLPPPVVVVEPAPVIVLPPPVVQQPLVQQPPVQQPVLLPPAALQPPQVPEQAAPAPEPEPAPEPAPAAAAATPDAEAPAPPPTLSADDQQALQQSLAAFAAEDYASALATLEALAARVPALGQAWLGVAHAAFALQRPERAAQALTQAALLGAFPRGYAFDPRVLYAAPERFDERLAGLATRAAAEPGNADLHLVLAWLRMSLGQRDEARASLDTVLTLRPATRCRACCW
ncbi:MAG: tetratricopeptide repeat protein [Planctomycetia bacterium]